MRSPPAQGVESAVEATDRGEAPPEQPVAADSGASSAETPPSLLEQVTETPPPSPSSSSAAAAARDREDMIKVLKVAVLCTAKLPAGRPTMRDVVKMLTDAGAGPCSPRGQPPAARACARSKSCC